MTPDIQRIFEQGVALAADELGIKVDAAELERLAAIAAANVVDLVSAKAWRDAKAAGAAAAAVITTIEQAEESARKPR